ncbi:MAG: peptidylprolyl isomerase [Clostridia bacterium]
MRKRAILALMLVVALAVTTSCSLIVKDAEVDKQTVIIEAAGKTFTKEEVKTELSQALDYQEYVYGMYGYPFDKTDAKTIAEAQDNVIKGLIDRAVTDQKKTELGFDTFTDEELAQMQAEVDETWDGYVKSITSGYFADTKLTGDELTKAIDAKMVEVGYGSKDTMLESQKTVKANEKLRADVVKDVAVTDDEVKAEYDSRVAAAMANYANDVSAYGSDVQNGATVYYVPAGYRYVKNILRKFSEEDATKISGFTTQITDKQTQLGNVTSSLAELGEDATADDELTAQKRADLTKTKATLDAELADLQTQLDAAKETAYAALQPTVDEILAKLAQSTDFDALIAEYGEDPGMQNEPGKTTGYPVCLGSTSWVAEFTDAAMALEKIGDVSSAVRSSYGIHFIQYTGDAAEGAVAFDTVKDTVQSELLTKKQDEQYTATVAQWATDAHAKIYIDRMAD